MIKWQRVYDSMLATPLQIRHVVAAHLGFVTFRLVTTCAVFMAVLAPFGVFETWWGPWSWRSCPSCSSGSPSPPWSTASPRG